LKGNALDNSVEIWSTNSILDWNTHNIDATNTINGKPIYYFNNQTGISVPSDAGEVILANCTDSAVNGVSISNLTVGIEIGFCSGVDIKNSTFTNLLGKAVFVYDGQNMSFVNNSFLDSHYGIDLYGSDAAFISENRANNTFTPVYIPSSSNYVDIENNTLNHSGDDAIYANSVYGITIANNSVSNSSGSAMYLLPSENGTIAYNRLSNNQNGIYLRYSTSTDNTIFNNSIEYTNNFGILVSSAQSNSIYNNTVLYGGNYGIQFSGAQDNHIWHNNFIGNTHQAYDNSNNIWNSSYPNGGNYWSDYSGNDIFRGANQDQQGQDGIGDSPYNTIDGGANQDNYPLMRPWNGTAASDTEAPHITGSNPANNSVNVSVSQQIIISFSEFMNQSSILYSCTPDPGGWTPSWSPATPTLTLYHSAFAYNTTHTFTITAGSDLSGKALTNLPYEVVFKTERDTIAPYVSITTPSDGEFLNTSYVDVQWAGGDNQTWIDHYEIRLDNNVSWADEGNNTAETFIGLSDGNHSIEVKAVDSAGNENFDSVNFTIDTVAPTLTIISPANNSYLPSLDITVYWNSSSTDVANYSVKLDSGTWFDVGMAENHTFYGLSEGQHMAYITAYDHAGNTNTSMVAFTVDTVDPFVVLDSPVDGSIFNTSTINITWHGWDNGTGIDHYNLSINGGVEWIVVGNLTSYTVSLDSGMFNLVVMAFDMAGNVYRSDTLNTTTILVDLIAPDVGIMKPARDSAFNTSSLTANWWGTDSTAGDAGLNHFEVMLDSGPWIGVGLNTTHELIGLSEGVHTFSVRVYDNAGNMNISSNDFWIDFTPPEFNITHPKMDSYLNTSYVNFTWNGGDNQSGINHYSFRIVGVSSWVNAGNGNYYQYPGYFNNGWHTVEIRGTDRAGNTLTQNVTFLVDTLRPTITVNNPTENGFWNRTEMEINWTASDSSDYYETSGLNHYEVSINGGGTVNVGLNTSYLITGLTDGSYEMTVTAFDNAGNHANYTIGITVDRTSPAVTITEPEDGLTIGNGYVDLHVNWTGDDTGAGIDHYETCVDNGTWVNRGSQNSAYVLSADGFNSVSGLHTFSVRAFDQAGNSAVDSVTFILDLAPPEVVNYSPQGENVSADSLISITFSEPINTSSFRIQVGGSYSVTGNVSWSGNTATFTPDKDLKEDVDVYVTASDVLDNWMMFNWSFSISEAVEPPSGTVTGTILDGSGAPVSGADIIYNGTIIGQTDENGTYSVELPPGTHNLTVSVNGESETISVNSSAGETTDAGESHTTLPSAGSNEDTGGASASILYLVVLLVVLGIAVALFMRKKGAKPGVAEESTTPDNEEANGSGETAGETEEPPMQDEGAEHTVDN